MTRKKVGVVVAKSFDSFFGALAQLGGKTKIADLSRWGIERIPSISYGDHGSFSTLDIYLPKERSRPLPVIFYIHGGAFRSLSKDTHWVMGRNFARAGYLVVNINYRLAPKDPYPAAIEDVCSAWLRDPILLPPQQTKRRGAREAAQSRS